MIGIGARDPFARQADELTDALAEMVHAFVTTYGRLPRDIETAIRELGLPSVEPMRETR